LALAFQTNNHSCASKLVESDGSEHLFKIKKCGFKKFVRPDARDKFGGHIVVIYGFHSVIFFEFISNLSAKPLE